MKKINIFLIFFVLFFLNARTLRCAKTASIKENAIFVSPDGDDWGGDGSIENPFATLNRAMQEAHAGNTVFLRGGVYDIDVRITTGGRWNKPVIVESYPGEWAIFDGAGHSHSSSNASFRAWGNWIIYRNFEVKNSPQDGFYINGASHIVVENIVVHNCYYAGFEVENGASHVLIVNCDSYENFDSDSLGEHADGFGMKFDVGKGNILLNCRAWNNSDDGFDMWEANNRVEISHCYSWGNGFDRWNVGDDFSGDGNGFKLGPGGHLIHHCMAWNNARRGFDYNDATDPIEVYNNTSYQNPVGFKFGNAPHILKNNLSYRDQNNYIGGEVVQQNNSWNLGIFPVEEDFITLDDSVLKGQRRADGSIPYSDFLRQSISSPFLDAGVYVGLPYLGHAPDVGAVEDVLFLSLPIMQNGELSSVF